MAVDTVLKNAQRKLKESPNLTDEEYEKMMSHLNDEDDIDDLDFNKKDYDVLEHIVFD